MDLQSGYSQFWPLHSSYGKNDTAKNKQRKRFTLAKYIYFIKLDVGE